eukprot:1492566-Pyramimonas_sp.AAC.1
MEYMSGMAASNAATTGEGAGRAKVSAKAVARESFEKVAVHDTTTEPATIMSTLTLDGGTCMPGVGSDIRAKIKPRSRRPKRPSTSIQQSTVVDCRH